MLKFQRDRALSIVSLQDAALQVKLDKRRELALQRGTLQRSGKLSTGHAAWRQSFGKRSQLVRQMTKQFLTTHDIRAELGMGSAFFIVGLMIIVLAAKDEDKGVIEGDTLYCNTGVSAIVSTFWHGLNAAGCIFAAWTYLPSHSDAFGILSEMRTISLTTTIPALTRIILLIAAPIDIETTFFVESWVLLVWCFCAISALVVSPLHLTRRGKRVKISDTPQRTAGAMENSLSAVPTGPPLSPRRLSLATANHVRSFTNSTAAATASENEGSEHLTNKSGADNNIQNVKCSDILAYPVLLSLFRDFCISEFTVEHAVFFSSVYNFRKKVDEVNEKIEASKSQAMEQLATSTLQASKKQMKERRGTIARLFGKLPIGGKSISSNETKSVDPATTKATSKESEYQKEKKTPAVKPNVKQETPASERKAAMKPNGVQLPSLPNSSTPALKKMSSAPTELALPIVPKLALPPTVSSADEKSHFVTITPDDAGTDEDAYSTITESDYGCDASSIDGGKFFFLKHRIL